MAELFPIAIDVEETAVGRVLRLLNRMPGIAKVHLFLSRDQMQETSATPNIGADDSHLIPSKRGFSKQTGNSIIAQVLSKTPAHYKILAAALERGGINPNSVHARLHEMSKGKLVRRTAPGTYVITEKGMKFFSRSDNEEVMGRQPTLRDRKGSQFGAKGLVLRALSSGKAVSLLDLGKLFREHSYARNNIYNVKNRLMNDGLIEYKDGMCSITEAGLAAYTEPSQNVVNSNNEGIAANG